MGLKQDVSKLMGSLFGKDTEELFNSYYDERQPEELLKACRDMLVKLLGPAAAHKYLAGLEKKHPEIQKFSKVILIE